MGLKASLKAVVPRPMVFFPKSVIINNPWLAVLYWSLLAAFVMFAGFMFFGMQQYVDFQAVDGEVTVLPWKLQRSLASIEESIARDQSAQFCNDLDHHEYRSSSIVYDHFNCATVCKKASRNVACMHPSEASILEGPAAVFVPTFYTNEILSPSAGPVETGHYFVPGAEDSEIAFRHRLTVPTKTYKAASLIQWIFTPFISPRHSAVSTEVSDDPMKRIKTVYLDKDGSIFKTFQPGEVVSMTVDEILQTAIVDEFVDTVSKLSLDDHYVRVEEDIIADREYGRDSGPTARLTGTKFMVDLQYTDSGRCALDPSSPPSHDFPEFEGYIACMTIKAARSWTTLERTSVVGEDGTQTNRRYHGLRVTFNQHGQFAFMDLIRIFEWISIFLIWSQIPTTVVYFFVITLLGNLSRVYTHIIHQNMNVIETVTGLAARLIAHSSSFLDMEEDGVMNRKNLLDRFLGIFRHSEDLDDEEVKKFVDFVYNGMVKEDKGQPAQGENQGGVPLQAYCSACTDNEPLSISMLDDLFDTDRTLRPLEYIFNDPILAGIRRDGKSMKISLAQPEEVKPLNGGKSGEVTSQYERIEHKKADTTKRVGKVTKAVSDYLEGWLGELHSIDKDELFARKRRELKRNGRPEARPAKVCDNGCVYQGEWVENCRHGMGSQHGNGYIYEGQWEANVYHGQGVLEMPSGVTYDGQFFNGKRHGSGFENAPSGMRYEGQYANGFKSGQGNFFMADGASYRGEVAENKMHGKGTYIWSAGHSYEGEWANDEMHGEGTYQYANGKKYVGQYSNNMQHGYGVFTWPDGRKYEGDFDRNEQHGQGTMRTPDGTSVMGTWVRGKQHGHCTITLANGKMRSTQVR
jgi:hypothetical protein